MVEIAEIVDRESFEAWLRYNHLSEEQFISASFRAAGRVFPAFWIGISSFANSKTRDEFNLSIVRALLVSQVFAFAATSENLEAIQHAAFLGLPSAGAAAAAGSTRSSVEFGVMPDDVARAAELSVYAVWFALRDEAFWGNAVQSVEHSCSDIERLWSEFQADVMALHSFGLAGLQKAPLWNDRAYPQERLMEIFHQDVKHWQAHGWAFWLDWYQRLLDGTEDRWDLLTDIALLDKDAEGNDLWQDPHKLAAEIARLEAEYVAKQMPAAPTVENDPLAEVIAATPNAEVVEYAPEKEAIHTVPLSDLPVDHLQDALDRLTDASEVFGPPDRFNNQYLALIPDIDKLRRALDRYANRPLRLHDVAADLSARLDNRILNGECPETEKDALVASYKADLAGAMVDLQAHDPRVVEAVKARLTHGVDSVEDEDLEVIEAGVTAAAKITDAVLRTELLEDLATIKDPYASPEESRQAIYRLGSRLPRILWVYRKEGVEGFLKITGVGQALEWSVSIIIRIFMPGA